MVEAGDTVALKLREAMPVRTVSVTVLQGPDRGSRAEGEQITIGAAEDNSLVLSDKTVSGYHVRLSAEKEGIRVLDFSSTNGTRCDGTRLERAVVQPGCHLMVGGTELEIGAGRPATVELHDQDQLGDLRGRTPVMRRLMKDLRKVAQSAVSVLFIGETGTGKELLARAIHEASGRSAKPFVTIDCGALTESLVASQLFGHEQGSFTGADRMKKGAFEHADGGTLFLDEIGELSGELQTMLLGALERRRFCRVGGQQEIAVDVRVVAATHRELREAVNRGQFRLDLFYRLAVVTLEVPPLRERIDDLSVLIAHFAREEGLDEKQIALLFDAEASERLRRHHWPGNVRELRNFVQATIAMGEAPILRDLAQNPLEKTNGTDFSALAELPYGQARAALLREFEREYLSGLLKRNQGNIAQAARAAEMARSHLNDLLRRHGLREDS